MRSSSPFSYLRHTAAGCFVSQIGLPGDPGPKGEKVFEEPTSIL